MSLDPRFKKFPLQSPDAILDSVYKGETMEKHFPEFEQSIEKNFDPARHADALIQPDAATAALYGEARDGKIRFPYSDKHEKGDGIRFYEGKIGDMTSSGHKENLKQNAQSITAKLEGKTFPDISKQEVELTGLLSNSGKKYTARTSAVPQLKDQATNKVLDARGQLSFPGSNQLSAYIAARQMKNIGFTREQARPLVAAIYAKAEPARWAKERNQRDQEGNIIGKSNSRDAFAEKYGKSAANLTEALARADVGYRDPMAIAEAKGTFARGDAIITQDLTEYTKEHAKAPTRAKKGQTVKNQVNDLHKGATQVSMKAAIKEKVDPTQASIKQQEESARRLQKESDDRDEAREQQELEQMEKENDAAMRRVAAAAVKTGIIIDAAVSLTEKLDSVANFGKTPGILGKEKEPEKEPGAARNGTLKKGVTSTKEIQLDLVSSLDSTKNMTQPGVGPIAGDTKTKKTKDLTKNKSKDLELIR